MVKTVGGVVRHAGPLSPDTLPSNAFIITVEEKKYTFNIASENFFAPVPLYA